MSLLTVLVALALRHGGWLDEPAALAGQLLRRWRDAGLERGQRDGGNGGLQLALVAGLPLLVLAVLLVLAGGRWGFLFEALLGVLVLGLAVLDRQRPGALARAQAEWSPASGTDAVAGAGMADLGLRRRELLAEQFRELFLPLLCFIVLGPLLVLAAYLLRLLAESEAAPAVARRLQHWLEWPAARVLALGFALAGDFSTTWAQWRQQLGDTSMPALDTLEDAAIAAQPVLPGQAASEALAATAGLLQRTLVLWVVLLALHTLFAF